MTSHSNTAHTVRFHVILPRDLLTTFDRVASKGKRSEFITEALREKLTHGLQGEALRATAGILDRSQYPEWETPEKISEWVRNLRAADNETIERNRGSR